MTLKIFAHIYTCKQHPCLHQFGDMTVTKLNKIDGIQKTASSVCLFDFKLVINVISRLV